MQTNKPEILAPSGNMDALKAAIAAGADACYLAGNSFGARAFAGNFTGEELLDAIYLAHLHDVKVYLTINTLIKDSEFRSLYEMLIPLYEAGLDSVLVQDLGIMDFVKTHFPSLPIHTSTQMNILTPEGALFAKEKGASRIVAAREMTLDELRRIKEEADIELEAFVHGAMCVCYSGRCLMSSMAGGRSGNRGCCAQPCRKKYNGSYKLSMRDMCTLKFIPQLVDIGIDSLKIEGRMKNEYYVASAVSAYKELVDDYVNGCFSADKADRYEKRLLDVFNRGGFTSGYLMIDNTKAHDKKRSTSLIDTSEPGRRGVYVGKVSAVNGGKVTFKAVVDINKGDELLIDTKEAVAITSGRNIRKDELVSLPAPDTRRIRNNTCIYRTRNKALTEELTELINNPRKVSVDMTCRLKKGDKIQLTVSYSDNPSCFITVEGDTVQEAVSNPVTEEVLRSKLTKLGDSYFFIKRFEAKLDSDIFVPASALKKLRREALEKLADKKYKSLGRKSDYSKFRDDSTPNDNISVADGTDINEENYREIHVSVADKEQFEALKTAVIRKALIADYMYLDMEMLCQGMINKDDISDSSLSGVKKVLAFPYVNRGDYSVNDIIRKYGNTFDGVYIRCIDDLAGLLSYFKSYFKEDVISSDNIKVNTVILAHSIYAYNSYAVSFLSGLFKDYGVRLYLEASYEISGRTNDAILYPEHVNLIRPVYGRIPLMVTDALDRELDTLDDGRGSVYHLRYSDVSHYTVLYDSKPLSLMDYESENQILKYDFTIEDYDEVLDVFKTSPEYIKNNRFTIGHYVKGI